MRIKLLIKVWSSSMKSKPRRFSVRDSGQCSASTVRSSAIMLRHAQLNPSVADVQEDTIPENAMVNRILDAVIVGENIQHGIKGV